MRRARAFAVALLWCGCQSAAIRPRELDAAVPSDAGVALDANPTERDQGAATDASERDSGHDIVDAEARDDGAAVDASRLDADAGGGPEIVLEDDFASSPFASAAPRWTIINHDDTSWHWASATMRTGDGPSCLYWGSRILNPDEPYCDEGPALVHSSSWDVGDGRFTIELDVYAAGADAGHRSVMLYLHRETAEAPRWEVDDAGNPQWPNRDYMAEVRMVLSGPRVAEQPHLSYCPQSRLEHDCGSTYVPSLATGAWYRWRIETCDDELRMSVTERDTGVEVFVNRVPLDVSAPDDYERVYLMLGGEDRDKAFDNVRVWRGCTGDP